MKRNCLYFCVVLIIALLFIFLPISNPVNAQRPITGRVKTVNKSVPVPTSWVYIYDKQKGYGFYVPKGTSSEFKTVKGAHIYIGEVPPPSNVTIVVLAYKDKTLTKDDLLEDAVDFLEDTGETVKRGDITDENEDYAVAEATSVSENGERTKFKILVGTDITDNYVMIIGTEESAFAARKDIIDAIWGSFEMWSGGASGKN